MELMDAAEKGEVIDLSDKSRKCGLNFAAYMIVKAIPLHMIVQVEEVARLLDNGQLVDVGDLWTGKRVKCPVC